jgi:hypothetical protein
MKLDLIPQPKRIRIPGGAFAVPQRGTIGITGEALAHVAQGARSLLGRPYAIGVSVPGVRDVARIALRDDLQPGGYRLRVDSGGITLEAESAEAAFHGLQTLRQIVRQSPAGRLPAVAIDDGPDFRHRGLYYDVCRGRVPTRESLLRLADRLAAYKINELQLYIEHTFRCRGHPLIGRGASPLTAEDILALDAHCRARHIELVPSLASFGHLATVLRHPPYRHLAEDWGIGKYLSPEAEKLRGWMRHGGWTLSPANPEGYRFLDSLFAEFLPLFSSTRFNVCCDETWDLGLGQSYALCRRKGRGRVYLGHILRLRELAARYGKRIMFWGDIIRHYPELIADIPKDVTVLDWGYSHNHPFDRVRDFRRAGVPFYVCPGTSSWVSLFPRLPEATANIHGFAEAGRREGAVGLLNTDWGDGGHYNFMEYSWHGYLFGAEQAWNTGADRASFTGRFTRLFLRDRDPALPRAIEALGEISHLAWGPCYQSIWQHLYFAPRGHALFTPKPDKAYEVRRGRIRHVTLTLDAPLGHRTLARLAAVRRTLAAAARRRGTDPERVLPYWLFAADTLAHAARKLAVLGGGGRDTAAARQALKREMRALVRRFKRLWLARNRPSEIRITLARYRKAIQSL